MPSLFLDELDELELDQIEYEKEIGRHKPEQETGDDE